MSLFPHDLPLDEANIVSAWVESLLYGVHNVLYYACMLILWRRRTGQRSAWILMTLITLLYLLATVHVSFSLRGLLEGFIWHYGGPGPDSALMYFADFAAIPYRMKDTVYVLNSIVADGLLVWRLSVVWNRNWWILSFPMLLYIATTATGIVATSRLWNIQPGDPLFLVSLGEWITSLWALTITTNITVTLLIVGRIWWISHRASSQRHYYGVMATLIESGALYSTSVVFLLATFQLKANVGQIVADMATQIAVISPTLIVVRIGLGYPRHSNSSRIHSGFGTLRGSSNTHKLSGNEISGQSLEKPQVVVEICRQTEIIGDQRFHNSYDSESAV